MHKMNIHTAIILTMSLGLAHIAGCADGTDLAAEALPAGDEAAAPGNETAAPGNEAAAPELQDELRRALLSYASALQRGDVAAVEALLSAEMRARIEERGGGADFASNLRTFVDREARKLARSTGESTRSLELFTAGSVQVGADRASATAALAINGERLAKPFYFVQENGGYKLNIVPPKLLALEYNYYQVKNYDWAPRMFSCEGATRTVGPGGQLQAKCADTCSGWFDGTEFIVNGTSVDCDYNSWGIDMYIVNNYPVCYDYC